MLGEVDGAHAASSQNPFDHVAGKHRARFELAAHIGFTASRDLPTIEPDAGSVR